VAFSDCRVQDLAAIVSWIAGRPEKPDLIIYAGDDVERFVPDPQTNYFEQLAALSTYGIVAVVGNDDLPDYRDLIRGHKVYEVHSRPVTIGRFLIVGVEGAPTPGIGITLHPEPEIANHLQRVS
jgi:Icc-related predicted phosphoesterase